MNEANESTCACVTCPGADCTCGCQETGAKAACACGPQCACGNTCACGNCAGRTK